MAWAIALFFYIAASLYLMNSSVVQHQSVAKMLKDTEGKFSLLVRKLKSVTVKEGLLAAAGFFGRVAAGAATLALILLALGRDRSVLFALAALFFVLSVDFWFSINWFVRHKETLKPYLVFGSLGLLGLIAFPVTDALNGTSATLHIYRIFSPALSVIGLAESPSGTVSAALCLVAAYVVSLLLVYFLISLLSLPFTAAAAAVILFARWFSTLLEKVFPEKQLTGLSVIVWLITTIILAV